MNNTFRKDRWVGRRSHDEDRSGKLDEEPRKQHHKSSDRLRKLQAKKARRSMGKTRRTEMRARSHMCIAVLYIVFATLDAGTRAASRLPTAVRVAVQITGRI